MTTRRFVLLSGGIDSTVALSIAFNDGYYNGECPTGVSIDYGQRHRKEIDAAQTICHYMHAPHQVLDLSSIVPKTMLTDKSAAIPNMSYSEIEGVSPTYVPFRNGLMLSAIASVAAGAIHNSSDDALIYYGAHAEDAHNWAYPDCTPEFNGAVANAIYVGTYHKVRLVTPLQWMKKYEVILRGKQMATPFAMTWSCYAGGDLHCGTCPTCRARKAGFQAAGVIDPTEYAA
jgi:7-cyano-7-deazaguanine synthase